MNTSDFFFPAFFTGEPFWKAAARMQIESVALVSRQIQALGDFQKVLATCHSPDEILTEQVRYWQIAQRHTETSLHKVFASVPLTVADAVASAEAEPAEKVQRPRDYMAVAERPGGQTKEQLVAGAPKSEDMMPPIRVRRTA